MQGVKMAKTNQYVQGMGSLCSEVQAGWLADRAVGRVQGRGCRKL